MLLVDGINCDSEVELLECDDVVLCVINICLNFKYVQSVILIDWSYASRKCLGVS